MCVSEAFQRVFNERNQQWKLKQKKTFIPKSGDWIIADIRHQDGCLSGHVGKVVKRAHGYFAGDCDWDPIVFDEKRKIEHQVTHIEVFRNYKAVFLYDENSKYS